MLKIFKNEVGAIGPIIMVLLLLGGLGVGLFLINKPTNLTPKASGGSVSFVNDSGKQISETSTPKVKIMVNSPWVTDEGYDIDECGGRNSFNLIQSVNAEAEDDNNESNGTSKPKKIKNSKQGCLVVDEVVISEDPNFSSGSTTKVFPYTGKSKTMVVDYEFSKSLSGTIEPGKKSIYVKFKSTAGQAEQNAKPFPATISYTGSGSSVSPTPTPSSPIANILPASFRRVFITSTPYNGNLGGLSGADAKCQDRANIVGLGGIWKAWLSDNNTSVSSRFDHASVPYVLLNGVTIANNWDDLTDGSLQSPINTTELKNLRDPYASVWTGTSINGSIANTSTTRNCNNWSSSEAGEYGFLGASNKSDRWWSEFANVDCNMSAYKGLYCFEQTNASVLGGKPDLKVDFISVVNEEFNVVLCNQGYASDKTYDLTIKDLTNNHSYSVTGKILYDGGSPAKGCWYRESVPCTDKKSCKDTKTTMQVEVEIDTNNKIDEGDEANNKLNVSLTPVKCGGDDSPCN